MLFEQFAAFGDEEDRAVIGLNVGVDQPFAEHSDDKVKAHEHRLQTKHLAMQLAGLVANSRIEGVEPRFEEASDIVYRALEDDLEDYTQYFFAFELMNTLRLVKERVHVLAILPIKVGGFEECWTYLSEATRCWLYGLDTASAALCRAALELPGSAFEECNTSPEPRAEGEEGRVANLIRAAYDRRLLDRDMREMAHEIRKAGNAILHGNIAQGMDLRDLLFKTRGVVGHIVSAANKGE